MQTPTGNQIAAARMMAGLNQRQLAKLMGVTAPTLCSYERGYIPPPHRLDAILKILKSYGIECIYTPEGVGVIKKNNFNGS